MLLIQPRDKRAGNCCERRRAERKKYDRVAIIEIRWIKNNPEPQQKSETRKYNIDLATLGNKYLLAVEPI